MASYPYYSEPTHDQGATQAGARDSAISSAEGRLIVNAEDRIFLLEPKCLLGR